MLLIAKQAGQKLLGHIILENIKIIKVQEMCKILLSVCFMIALILVVEGNYLLVKVEDSEGINCNTPQNLKFYNFLITSRYQLQYIVIIFQFRDEMVHRV